MMNVAPPGRIESPHHLLLEPALSLRRSVIRESASGSAGSLLSSAESCLERKPAHCRLTSAARILLLGTAPRCSLQPFSKRVNLPTKEPLAFSQYKRLGTLRVSTSGTILFENCSSIRPRRFYSCRVCAYGCSE